jgi:hypothetical protein
MKIEELIEAAEVHEFVHVFWPKFIEDYVQSRGGPETISRYAEELTLRMVARQKFIASVSTEDALMTRP